MDFDFSKVKNICVVGLRDNPTRPSYMVSEYLKRKGFKIIPVNLAGEDVLGEKGYKSIADIPLEIPIDIADFFVRADNVYPLVAEALDRGIKVIWLQVGIADKEAARLAEEKGATMIMDRCIKVAHEGQQGRSCSL